MSLRSIYFIGFCEVREHSKTVAKQSYHCKAIPVLLMCFMVVVDIILVIVVIIIICFQGKISIQAHWHGLIHLH